MSARRPGARGAIAAGHPVTAEVGAEVLRAGGTAVDACVAAAFASWVAEPALTGPGGGGFLVAHDAARARPFVLDFFTAVPGAGHSGPVAPLEPYVVDFGTGRQTFLVGPGSCAVPGVTAGLEAAHRRLGRLPWAELARPAIALARAGVEMTAAHADVITLLTGFLGASPEGARVFGPSERPLRAGEITSNPPLADTLERIAANGARELADGETAHALAAHQAATGGALTLADLGAYRAIRRRPVTLPYRERTFVTNPPPSSGGALIAHALAVLAAGPPLAGVLAPASVARIAAALRSANAQRTPAFERSLYRGGAVRHVLSAAAPSARSPLDNPHQRARRRRQRRVPDLFDGLRLGRRGAGHGRAPQQHAGRDRPPRRLAASGAGHAADEHDGAVARARAGRRGRARAGVVRIGADPLGDRAGRGRRARPRAPAAGGGRASARASGRRRPRLRGRHPAGDARCARGGGRAARALARPQHLLRRRPGGVAHARRGSPPRAIRAGAAPASSSQPDEGGWGADGGLSKKPLR